uniref:Uncharacterized protein n=1 Tax=Anguilla anguilla TaxID=7936 RepID=A0A0E9QV91_ANGAN
MHRKIQYAEIFCLPNKNDNLTLSQMHICI